MIQLNDVLVVPANTLQPGTVAFLHQPNKFIAIGTNPQGAPSAVILDTSADFFVCSVGALLGDATEVLGFKIEVDPLSGGSLHDLKSRQLALIVHNGKVAIQAVENHFATRVEIASMPGANPNMPVGFERWCIAWGSGGERQVLFNRG